MEISGRGIRTSQLITIFSIALFIQGCAMNDANVTRAQGAGVGCIAGGVLAHVIGIDEAAGCALGGALGLAYGHHVASKKAQFATQESYLNAVIAEADKVARESRALNQQLRVQIARLQGELQSIQSRHVQASSQKRMIKAHRKETKKWIAETEKAIKRVSAEIDVQRQVLAKESSAAPQNYVTVAEHQINELELEKRAFERGMIQLQVIDKRRAY